MGLEALKMPYDLVRPQRWKNALGVVGTGAAGKKAARIVAMRLFPDLQENVAKHDGMVDALLIAEFGRRLLKGEES